MKTPLKNWKVFINGILTITLMVPTTWPTSVAQATEVEAPNAEFVTPKDTSFYDSLDTSNCTIGFDQQLNNFIANFNKKYPQEEVQIQQIHQIIGKTTSVESAAQAYDDPDLQLQALQLVNFIYEKCTDEDEAAFTGVIYKIMATQMTLFQDENKVVDAYRPMQMLLTVIGSKFFTSDLMSERQKNRDSLFHNTIEWMPWVALASTLGTVAFYKRNPLKIWKDAAANAVKRKLGKKIFNSRSSEEEIFRNEAMAWYKTHHVDGVVTQEG
ncbi:MAG: hypothetical protein KDD40_05815, partial [Bdellovibrionales bacterium]|nr:hypothetical protein [Bdellovibrionales bacterium]